MRTKKKYRKNLHEFEIVFHHRHNRSEKKDKIWICESVGTLKGGRQQAKAKINELSIHTIADLQIRVHHHCIPKVPIQGFDQIYDIALHALPGNPPPYLKDHRKAKIRIFHGMD